MSANHDAHPQNFEDIDKEVFSQKISILRRRFRTAAGLPHLPLRKVIYFTPSPKSRCRKVGRMTPLMQTQLLIICSEGDRRNSSL